MTTRDKDVTYAIVFSSKSMATVILSFSASFGVSSLKKSSAFPSTYFLPGFGYYRVLQSIYTQNFCYCINRSNNIIDIIISNRYNIVDILVPGTELQKIDGSKISGVKRRSGGRGGCLILTWAQSNIYNIIIIINMIIIIHYMLVPVVT